MGALCEPLGPNRYVAHAKDFVPQKELRIGFIAQQHRR
jgi:hypothetical protein